MEDGAIRGAGLLFFMAALLVFSSPALAKMSGYFNLNRSEITEYENGEEMSSSESFSQNYYVNYGRRITPYIDLNLDLRAALSDVSSDSQMGPTSLSKREAEPGLNLTLQNPMYEMRAGYRRRDSRTEGSFSGESARDAYYVQFAVTPRGLPFLALQFDETDATDERDGVVTSQSENRSYQASSGYAFNISSVAASYILSYSHPESRSGPGIFQSSEADSYSGVYTLAYNGRLGRRASVNVIYTGDYSHTDSKTKFSQTGEVVLERRALTGLHALGTDIDPTVDTLAEESDLADGDTVVPVTAIDLAGGLFHNIGVQLLSRDKAVDRLFVYVNADVTTDSVLTDPTSWRAYKSDTNISWNEIPIARVDVTEYNSLNGIFRYEIFLAVPENALFFKLVNLRTAMVPGAGQVMATELEALGAEIVPASGSVEDSTSFFGQGFSFLGSVRPFSKVTISASYILNRSDSEPDSLQDSFIGFIPNLWSNELSKNEKWETIITKTYNVSTRWEPSRLFNPSVRASRSEFFDRLNLIDSQFDSYVASLDSYLLPTLNLSFQAIKSESFEFSEKMSKSMSYHLTVGTQLYRHVDMTTDFSYRKGETFGTEPSKSRSKAVNGNIDAQVTRKVFTAFRYMVRWEESHDSSARSRQGDVTVSYRPAAFLNFSGNFRVVDNDGETTTSEGGSVSWLPLPVLRLSADYQRFSDPGSREDETYGGSVVWSISDKLKARASYSASKDVYQNTNVSETRFFGVSLSGQI